MPLPFILHLDWKSEACMVGRHLQVKILVKLRKKKKKRGLLQHWNPEFLFQPTQLSQQPQLLSFVIEKQLVMLL